MSLNRRDIDNIALLARLALTSDEIPGYIESLSRIVGLIGELDRSDTAQIEPMAHPLPLQNVFRDDEPAPSLTVDEALANAPKRIGPYYGVPAVFD